MANAAWKLIGDRETGAGVKPAGKRLASDIGHRVDTGTGTSDLITAYSLLAGNSLSGGRSGGWGVSSWTRKLTWPDEFADDWMILREGLVVGRCMRDHMLSSNKLREAWMWSTLTLPPMQGHEDTLEAALERVRQNATDLWGHLPYPWPLEE